MNGQKNIKKPYSYTYYLKLSYALEIITEVLENS